MATPTPAGATATSAAAARTRFSRRRMTASETARPAAEFPSLAAARVETAIGTRRAGPIAAPLAHRCAAGEAQARPAGGARGLDARRLRRVGAAAEVRRV